MTDPVALAAVAAVFLLAGAVKGVVGLGLPTVSLGLLAMAFDLTTAMTLLLAPSFVTNFWQACVGGHGREILKRTWPFLFLATTAVWFGAEALTTVDAHVLTGLLGLLLVAYGGSSLAGMRLSLAPGRRTWVGPAAGAVNGVLTGMTGSFVVPGVLYLQAVGLPRDMLVQAMGILFTLSTVALAVALGGRNVLGAEVPVVSALAVAPALLGMVLGRRVRAGLSEAVFRKALFAAILVLGGCILARAVVAA